MEVAEHPEQVRLFVQDPSPFFVLAILVVVLLVLLALCAYHLSLVGITGAPMLVLAPCCYDAWARRHFEESLDRSCHDHVYVSRRSGVTQRSTNEQWRSTIAPSDPLALAPSLALTAISAQ